MTPGLHTYRIPQTRRGLPTLPATGQDVTFFYPHYGSGPSLALPALPSSSRHALLTLV